MCTGRYDVEPCGTSRWIDAVGTLGGPPHEGADEEAQHRRQPAQVGLLEARALAQAELERDMAGVIVEQLQLNSYVMIAPKIVVSNGGIVANESCEYYNKVRIP